MVNAFTTELRPIVSGDGEELYTVWFIVGQQQFCVTRYGMQKGDAEQFCILLERALHTLAAPTASQPPTASTASASGKGVDAIRSEIITGLKVMEERYLKEEDDAYKSAAIWGVIKWLEGEKSPFRTALAAQPSRRTVPVEQLSDSDLEAIAHAEVAAQPCVQPTPDNWINEAFAAINHKMMGYCPHERQMLKRLCDTVSRPQPAAVDGWLPKEQFEREGTRVIAWLSSDKGFEDITTSLEFENGVWIWAEGGNKLIKTHLINGVKPWPAAPHAPTNAGGE